MSRTKPEREYFLEGMGRLVKSLEMHFKNLGPEDTLPDGYVASEDEDCTKGVPSLGQMAAMLNEYRHGTIFNKKWTRHSLKLLLEELRERGVETNVGHVKCKTSRANQKRSCKADIHALEVYEKYLMRLDVEDMTNSELSRQLNKSGSKTIRGNDWSPAGCGKLIERLKKNGILT